MQKNEGAPPRTQYYDYLRILATFAVMFVHVIARGLNQNWHSAGVTTLDWQVFNFYESMLRWPIVVFIMISGSLFLNRDMRTTKIYSKYILRIVTAFLFWSVVYTLADHKGGTLLRTLGSIALGHYHMWFLYLIVGIYIFIPFMHNIVQSPKLTRYFLWVAFVINQIVTVSLVVVQLVIRTEGLSELVSRSLAGLLKSAGPALVFAVGASVALGACLYMVMGFCACFVLGHYLSHTELEPKQRRLVYGLGAGGFAATTVLSAAAAVLKGEPTEAFYWHFAVNVLAESIALFVFAKYELSKLRLSGRGAKAAALLSQYSFGAYLVHPLLLSTLAPVWNALPLPAPLAVPVVSVILFGLSFAVSAALNKIPVLNRYIV